MAQSKFSNRNSCGFTIMEVLVAALVLTIGLLSAAALIGGSLGGTARSEYMTQAATLASEKLEALNRYPSSDPNITVTNGTSAGSLAADTTQTFNVNGTSVLVPYYDEVYFSPSQGFIEEAVTSLNAQGAIQYTTITQTAAGTVTPVVSSTPPGFVSGAFAFERRWIIELNTPEAGVRRVTVLVTLLNQSVQPPVTFQMTTVRQ